MNPLANAAHFATDGYRDHSAAERNTFNARARWLVMAGARNSVVDMKSHNHLPLTSGAADSGVRFLAFNPVAGVTYRVSPALNVYGAYRRGFETPTLNDLAYRSTDGSLPGLNFGLRPARSDDYELGVQICSGGRTVFNNIGATQRKGAEFSIEAPCSSHFDGRLAYTYIEAVTAAGQRLPARFRPTRCTPRSAGVIAPSTTRRRSSCWAAHESMWTMPTAPRVAVH